MGPAPEPLEQKVGRSRDSDSSEESDSSLSLDESSPASSVSSPTSRGKSLPPLQGIEEISFSERELTVRVLSRLRDYWELSSGFISLSDHYTLPGLAEQTLVTDKVTEEPETNIDAVEEKVVEEKKRVAEGEVGEKEVVEGDEAGEKEDIEEKVEVDGKEGVGGKEEIEKKEGVVEIGGDGGKEEVVETGGVEEIEVEGKKEDEVRDSVKKGLAEVGDKRVNIIKEIIDTEGTYIRGLKELIEVLIPKKRNLLRFTLIILQLRYHLPMTSKSYFAMLPRSSTSMKTSSSQHSKQPKKFKNPKTLIAFR